MTNGLRVFTSQILGVKPLDLAFIYTIVILLYSLSKEKSIKISFKDSTLNRLVWVFFVFLILSALFSRYYYNFTWIQIFQGGRHHFLFISYFFLIKTKKEDVLWIVRVLFKFTIIHSILYCVQVITTLPVLPYGEIHIEQGTGLARYYNSPVYLSFYLFVVVLFPKYFKAKYNTQIIILFLITLFLTQGRTFLIICVLCIFIGFYIQGALKKSYKYVILGTLIVLPFIDIISSRFEGDGREGTSTMDDIKSVISGEFKSRAVEGTIQDGGTFEYRFAWVYERMLYLSHRPLAESIFGLGMISDSQYTIVQRRYRFGLGLSDSQTGYTYQLSTPDIAYGNLITQYGYVGGILLLSIWIRLLMMFYRKKLQNSLVFSIFLFLFSIIIGSLSGSTISTTGNLIFPFLFINLLISDTSNNKLLYECKN